MRSTTQNINYSNVSERECCDYYERNVPKFSRSIFSPPCRLFRCTDQCCNLQEHYFCLHQAWYGSKRWAYEGFSSSLLFLLPISAGTVHVQQVLHMFRNLSFDGKMFSSQVSFVELHHKTSNSIACSKCSNNYVINLFCAFFLNPVIFCSLFVFEPNKPWYKAYRTAYFQEYQPVGTSPLRCHRLGCYCRRF